MEEANSQQNLHDTSIDVQAVERELNDLWMRTAGAEAVDEEGAMLRARVLNLLVYVTTERGLSEADEMLMDVAMVHPCRALVMLAEHDGDDRDIEMHVSSRCRMAGGEGGRHLCCEQVTLRARGRFTVELPSVSVPLLVSDLPVFLWWRAQPPFDESVFRALSRAADRIIIDSALFERPSNDLRALAGFLQKDNKRRPGMSDLNWARLTAWRALLASFYDVPEHAEAFARLSRVRIDYISPEAAPEAIGPKALILAGWLASRLDWSLAAVRPTVSSTGAHTFVMEKGGRQIVIEFRPVLHRAVKPGGIARVELIAETAPRVSFIAIRTEEFRDLETQKSSGAETRTTRVIAGGDRTEAGLLAAELEILSRDRVYEAAVAKAVELLSSS